MTWDFDKELTDEGWVTDYDWGKVVGRTGGHFVTEAVMRDIASRWDANRLDKFPENTKFKYTAKDLPTDQEHFILIAPKCKLTMLVWFFGTVFQVYWKVENEDEYLEWCKERSSKIWD